MNLNTAANIDIPPFIMEDESDAIETYLFGSDEIVKKIVKNVLKTRSVKEICAAADKACADRKIIQLSDTVYAGWHSAFADQIEPNPDKTLWRNIKRARIQRGMTTAQAALACRMPENKLRDFENGNFFPSVRKVQEIAAAVGLDISMIPWEKQKLFNTESIIEPLNGTYFTERMENGNSLAKEAASLGLTTFRYSCLEQGYALLTWLEQWAAASIIEPQENKQRDIVAFHVLKERAARLYYEVFADMLATAENDGIETEEPAADRCVTTPTTATKTDATTPNWRGSEEKTEEPAADRCETTPITATNTDATTPNWRGSKTDKFMRLMEELSDEEKDRVGNFAKLLILTRASEDNSPAVSGVNDLWESAKEKEIETLKADLQQKGKDIESLTKKLQETEANYADKMQASKESIDKLRAEKNTLTANLAGAGAKIERLNELTDTDILLGRADVEEYFDGEQRDMALEAISGYARNLQEGSRRKEILDGILAANSPVGELQRRRDALTAAISKSPRLTPVTIRELKDIGFGVTVTKTHYKVIYHDCEKYISSIACTPSDIRGMQNVCREIIAKTM